MDEHNNPPSTVTGQAPPLPRSAYLPINRCNLPAQLLGGLLYQQFPVPLVIDGVRELHRALFALLDEHADPEFRAGIFEDYLRINFLLRTPDEAGFAPADESSNRVRADYRRLVRGWMFDPDGREAAVLKGWVESRFGLLPRNHKGPLESFQGENYLHYLESRSRGLYNTNALEAQIDLLYSYAQYELHRRWPGQTHRSLFRGVNALAMHEQVHRFSPRELALVLNNLNSFTDSVERADEFGDYVLRCTVPTTKLLYFPDLLPRGLRGEGEFLVIGGLYRIELVGL